MTDRITYGTETCHDCGAKPGENHVPGCDVEQCTYCGGQWIQCGHSRKKKHKPDLSYWTGVWPGTRECIELDWYVVFTKDGWQMCTADTPDARPDLTYWSHWLGQHAEPVYPLKRLIAEDPITKEFNLSRDYEMAHPRPPRTSVTLRGG